MYTYNRFIVFAFRHFFYCDSLLFFLFFFYIFSHQQKENHGATFSEVDLIFISELKLVCVKPLVIFSWQIWDVLDVYWYCWHGKLLHSFILQFDLSFGYTKKLFRMQLNILYELRWILFIPRFISSWISFVFFWNSTNLRNIVEFFKVGVENSP